MADKGANHSTADMNSQRVMGPSTDGDEDAEALRFWAWIAVKRAGGTVIVSYDEFLRDMPSAVLRWKIDPSTLALTIVAI